MGIKKLRKKHEYPNINDHVLEEILKRCGKYIIKIDSKLDTTKKWKKTIEATLNLLLFDKYCPNIQSITCKNSKGVGIYCFKNIKEFNVGYIYHETSCFYICQETETLSDCMSKFLFNHKNLQVFGLIVNIHNRDVSGSSCTCLMGAWWSLPLEELTTFELLGNYDYLEKEVTNFIKGSKKIRTLSLNLYGNMITAISSSCFNLIELSLRNEFKFRNIDRELSQIFINNKNLRSLKLENFLYMTGECLLSLNKNVIENVKLARAGHFQSEYFICLSSWKKLHSLTIHVFSLNDFSYLAESVS